MTLSPKDHAEAVAISSALSTPTFFADKKSYVYSAAPRPPTPRSVGFASGE